MSSATYTFKWNQAKLNDLRSNVMARMLNLGFKTAAEAQHGAPVQSGVLINSIRVTTDHKNTVFVLAGGPFAGKNVPYARRREYEKNVPYARRREYENNLHPNKKYYMKNAFGWLNEHYAAEFKGVTK